MYLGDKMRDPNEPSIHDHNAPWNEEDYINENGEEQVRCGCSSCQHRGEVMNLKRLVLSAVIAAVLITACGDSNDPPPIKANNAPVAFAGVDQTVFVGSLVTLDGSGSYDLDNQPLNYSWSMMKVPFGNTALLANANTVRPTFTPNVSGEYVARLIVIDVIADKESQMDKASAPSFVTVRVNHR